MYTSKQYSLPRARSCRQTAALNGLLLVATNVIPGPNAEADRRKWEASRGGRPNGDFVRLLVRHILYRGAQVGRDGHHPRRERGRWQAAEGLRRASPEVLTTIRQASGGSERAPHTRGSREVRPGACDPRVLYVSPAVPP